MTALHNIDTLRLDLVGVRATLRSARQDLSRKKRSVARTVTLSSRTAKEREAELDRVVHEHPDVIAAEDTVLRLQHEEDLAVARLEIALRPVQEQQWYVRERLADSAIEMATSLATLPGNVLCHLVHTNATASGDRGTFLGESDYLEERLIE